MRPEDFSDLRPPHRTDCASCGHLCSSHRSLSEWPIACTHKDCSCPGYLPQVYYTVVIPYSELPTQWHPTQRVGPFSTLTRGVFPTDTQAHAWASANLGGQPYSVRPIDTTVDVLIHALRECVAFLDDPQMRAHAIGRQFEIDRHYRVETARKALKLVGVED